MSAKFPFRGLIIALAFVTVVILVTVRVNRSNPEQQPFSEFVRAQARGNIAWLEVRGQKLRYRLRGEGGEQIYRSRTTVPLSTEMLERYVEHGAEVVIKDEPIEWRGILFSVIPIVFLVLFLWYVLRYLRNNGAGDGGAMQFGRSRARIINQQESKISFSHVAGADEAKQDLQEVVAFLKNPQQFHNLGARIPRGVLMVGPPGAGKTLLARAVAGEAEVPFFSLSGSDFVEMFVGVGAARVRNLFDNAKKTAPCILFIDEIDAVGRRRGNSSFGGGNDEREQTLNALLVEMDGFESQDDIIVMAATNRPDILDPALLRPGRFDRQVVVDAPDIKGREAILRIHAEGKPLSSSIDLRRVARRTPGFVGADLENLLNEAALIAARAQHRHIQPEDIDEAADRVTIGSERRSRVISDKQKRITAYHETGHALAAYRLEHADSVHKITIVPRGRALGYVMQLPEEERTSLSYHDLLDMIAVALAGRAAEEIFLEDITTGAQDDLQRATNLARRMVTQWGMSPQLGTISLDSGEVSFLGDYEARAAYAESTAQRVDEEVHAIMTQQYQRVKNLLKTEQENFGIITAALLERETLHADEFALLMRGEPLPEVDPEPDASSLAPAVGLEPLEAEPLPDDLMPT